jgi:hypothetical protein
MLNIALAMRESGNEGKPLPIVFPQMKEIGAHPRQGQITLVCAAPGGGKSAWMSEYAINLFDYEEDRYMRGIYFSADTDRMTLGKRAAAGLLQCTINEAEEYLQDNRYDIWDILKEKTEHIWVCFDAGLTLQDIDEEIQVYAYTQGAWPEFVVVDVLMNVQGSASSGDHVAYQEAMEWFHMIARNTGAAFFVLHHVTGEFENGKDPIPLRGILGKISKLPRLILTFHQPIEGMLGVSVVKNSSGPRDTEGFGVKVNIPWLPERSWFGRKPEDIYAIQARRIADTLIEEEAQFQIWG